MLKRSSRQVKQDSPGPELADLEDDGQNALFEMPPDRLEKIALKTPQKPVWTENKGLLVAEYLSLFLFVTRRGTYIDGFGGPQALEFPHSWAARLVLSLNTAGDHHFFLNRFHLFDLSPFQIKQLDKMIKEVGGEQDIRLWPPSDFNKAMDALLVPDHLPDQPTFCLLDQRCFECEWRTLERLAAYKSPKIELLYFMPEGWLSRSLAASARPEKLDEIERWWGGKDWDILRSCTGFKRAEIFIDRFQTELEYRFVHAYPIKERDPKTGGEGRTMYYMIHCSDHPEAPKFMNRAYRKTCLPKSRLRELRLKI